MGNQTVMIHCDQCGVSSPRDISELIGDVDGMRCHVCGARFSQEALTRAQQASKVIVVRAKR